MTITQRDLTTTRRFQEQEAKDKSTHGRKRAIRSKRHRNTVRHERPERFGTDVYGERGRGGHVGQAHDAAAAIDAGGTVGRDPGGVRPLRRRRPDERAALVRRAAVDGRGRHGRRRDRRSGRARPGGPRLHKRRPVDGGHGAQVDRGRGETPQIPRPAGGGRSHGHRPGDRRPRTRGARVVLPGRVDGRRCRRNVGQHQLRRTGLRGLRRLHEHHGAAGQIRTDRTLTPVILRHY